MDPERTPRPSALGQVGEQRAAAWYEERGFEILDRNWRSRDGEIDLVARSGATLVVCEVKSRSSGRTGTPVEAVTRRKQLRLRRLAAQWLRDNRDRIGPARVTVRFDVASFVGGRLEIVQEAF